MANMSDDEKHKIFMAICDAMRAHTADGLAAVYGVISEQKGHLVGSGTFIRLNGATYLLTAAHVAAQMAAHETLAHSSTYAAKPEVIRNPLICQEHPLDVALVRIANDVVAKHDLKPWPVGMLANTADHSERDILFVHGYPGERSGWLPIMNGGVGSESLPFGGSDASSSWMDFDDKLHVTITYPPDGWFDRNGKPIKMPEPEGLSGSALWQTYRRDISKDWSASVSRIIGVIHRYDPVSNSLVATRIEAVRDFALMVIRREAAYFHWLANGQPAGTELADWAYAEQRIPALA